MRAHSALCAGHLVRSALKIYLLSFELLWGLSLGIVGIQRYFFHQHYPFNTFLFTPDARFSDFTVYVQRFLAWNHSNESFFTLPGFPFDYPAPLLVFELAFFKLTSSALLTYLNTVVIFAVALGSLVAFFIHRTSKALDKLLAIAAAMVTAIFSFPLLYLIDRGNIEGLVWIATSLGLLLFVLRRYTSAAFVLALAVAMKIFPVVLLLLLLAKRRYRDFFTALVAVAAITYGALWLTGPSVPVAAKHIADGLNFLRKDQILEYKSIVIGFDHSLFASIKQVVFRMVHSASATQALLPALYLTYGLVVATLFLFVYVAGIRRMPVANQILALSALSVLLPFVSYDYTLVHMYAPFALILVVLGRDVSGGQLSLSRAQMLILLLPFAVIFTPQTYLVHSVVGYGAQVKTCAMLFLIGAALAIPLPSSIFNELPEREILQLHLKSKLAELATSKREFV